MKCEQRSVYSSSLIMSPHGEIWQTTFEKSERQPFVPKVHINLFEAHKAYKASDKLLPFLPQEFKF